MARNHSMEDSTRSERRELEKIAGLVASLPDREPPDAILDAVMARVQPKRAGRLARWWRRLRTPVPMSPLWPAITGAVAAVLLVVAVLPDPIERTEDPDTGTTEEAATERTVLFTLDMPQASRVDLIGSFNRWSPGRFTMQWDESRGLWVIRLKLGQGRHEYAFLVDGKRAMPDPNARFQEDDGFGNTNSILVVQGGNGHETGI